MNDSKVQLRKVVSIVLLTLLVAFTACGRGGLSLSPVDDKANTHFVNALKYKNQFSGWLEEIAELSGEDRPTIDEWRSSLALLERAIEEGKQVSPDFMKRAHPDLPYMWQGFFIPAMEKRHSYYSAAINDPSVVKLPSTDEGMKQLTLLLEGYNLDVIFASWYDQNVDAIRAGIRKMAK